MQIDVTELDGGIQHIRLAGRMDIEGTQAIDLKFTALTASRRSAVIVDLSEVSFLASIGMRTLLSSAKALGLRGGKMVLLSPQPMVATALSTAGIDTLIPVHEDLGSARQALADVAGA
ncbi:MAG: STAS domain-containing protein [Gammaproteobacteria bacterium]|jgi:anti-anti-sigma factor|nr:STAS domain-containing protein [Gammaproteobacteria bacterium]